MCAIQRPLAFKPESFAGKLLKLALPMVFQQLLTVLLTSLDTVLLGQRMGTEVTAAGLANQIVFIYVVIVFGINSGGAIFTAQYWGKNQDIPAIHKIMGIQLGTSAALALLFTTGALCFPEQLMQIYSKDPVVVAMGADYLRITALNYIIFAIISTYTMTARAMGKPQLGLIMVTVALIADTFLSWMFIFGKLGWPAMGIRGAALATALGRVVELAGVLFLVYRYDMPIAVRWKRLFSFDKTLVARFFQVTAFVIVVEASWSVGTSMYNVAYKELGTAAQTAVQISGTFQGICMIIAIGLGNACAVMIGHLLGAGDKENALRTAKRMALLSIAVGVVLGGGLALLAPWIVGFFKVSADVARLTENMFYVITGVLPIRCLEYMIMIGILRAGGDTRFSMIADIVAVWGVGVPLAFLAVYAFGWPVYFAALLVNCEILCKCIVCGVRSWNRKWMRQLV